MMSLWPVRLAASIDRWKPLASHTLPKASRYSSFCGVYGHCSTAMAFYARPAQFMPAGPIDCWYRLMPM